MINAILLIIIISIAASIIWYLCRAKKRGETCIGCPHSKQCGGKCGGKCGS